jgi:enamine deaminase RidA (YjgF/YER057c/UK114 family)
VTKRGDTIYVSGSPPFDPKTGEIVKGSIERQTGLYWINSSSVLKRRALLWKTF